MKKLFSSIITLSIILAVSLSMAADVSFLWDAPPDGGRVDGYRVYQKVDINDSYSTVAVETNATTLEATVTGLDEEETYYFICRAFNTAGESIDSNEVTYSVPLSVPGQVQTFRKK